MSAVDKEKEEFSPRPILQGHRKIEAWDAECISLLLKITMGICGFGPGDDGNSCFGAVAVR